MNMTQSQIQSNLITTYASRGLTCLMSAGLALLVLAAVGSRSVASEGHPPAVFRWQTSSPEDQGMVGAKLEDIPVSQKVELVNDREVITYEMKCILRPQI